MKNNVKNERLKRRFFKWMKEANGYSNLTINAIEKSIWLYEDFTNHADFRGFNSRTATNFKKWLEERKYRGKQISITTVYHYLRFLKGFFLWVSGQPGYKSKIDHDSISYLSLEKKKVRNAIAPKRTEYPTLEYVKKLIKSIEPKTEIDKRDRALIAFLVLSGMRDKAMTSLPLGCFDREKLEVRHYTDKGVDTKFGKSYISYLFKFDDDLVNDVIEWAKYLETEKLFGSDDPLFPRSKVEQEKDALTFVCKRVEPVFWKGTGSIRQMLRNRSQSAGLRYYHPHSFRHLAVCLARKNCKTAEELKAVSQNFGHEYIGTTMMNYGKLDDFRVEEIVSNMDFSDSGKSVEQSQEIEEVIKRLQKMKNRA